MTVVGIGADGWDGLSPAARRAIARRRGAARQLAAAGAGAGRGRPPSACPGPRRWRWPCRELPTAHPGRRVVVLASGDPMFSGIGTTLVRWFGAAAVDVVPHPSSVTLACSRMGWSVEETTVVLGGLAAAGAAASRSVTPGRRLLVLGRGRQHAGAVAALAAPSGATAPSRVTALGPAGRRRTSAGSPAPPRDWPHAADRPAGGHRGRGRRRPRAPCRCRPCPGLPDERLRHDGQLTKRDVRAVTLARLAPLPGPAALGRRRGRRARSASSGCGRTPPAGRSRSRPAPSAPQRIAAERRAARRARAAGRGRLGAGGAGRPAAARTPSSSAAGATAPVLLEACWAALAPGGRLVVNAVTLESEAVLADWHGRWGGGADPGVGARRPQPVGGFTGWKAADARDHLER